MSTNNSSQTPGEGSSMDSDQIADLAEVEDSKLASKSASYSQGQLIRRRFFSHKPAMISLIVLAFVTVLSFTAIGFFGIPGWWDKHFQATGSIVDGGRPQIFQDGNFLGEHPFGQENVGRDYFAMVMRGAQQSLLVALFATVVSSVIGIVVGAVAGYFRGWVESALMRLTDFIIVVPTLVFAAILGVMVRDLPGGVIPFAIALGCVTWTGMARLVRAEVLSLREKEYVSAAISMGAHPARIIGKHMLPNSIGVIIVNATFTFAGAILTETTLSYLGLGVQRPEVSLGLLIQQYESAFTNRPWLFWFPGIFIVIIALTANFIGDGLRDAFDPRQTRKGDRRPSLGSVLGLRGLGKLRNRGRDIDVDEQAQAQQNAGGGSGGSQSGAVGKDPNGNPG